MEPSSEGQEKGYPLSNVSTICTPIIEQIVDSIIDEEVSKLASKLLSPVFLCVDRERYTIANADGEACGEKENTPIFSNTTYNTSPDVYCFIKSSMASGEVDSPQQQQSSVVPNRKLIFHESNYHFNSTAPSQSRANSATRTLSSSRNMQSIACSQKLIDRRTPTVPVSPSFNNRSNSNQRGPKLLSTEELEIKRVKESKYLEKERLEKNAILFEKNKIQKFVPAAVVTAVVRKSKDLTIPVTPIHNLSNRLGKKAPLLVNANKDAERAAVSQDHGPKKPTVPKPFTFQTETRAAQHNSGAHAIVLDGFIESQSTASTENDCVASTTTLKSTSHIIKTLLRDRPETYAEKALVFLHDARRIETSTEACKKLTVPKAPLLRTEQRSLSRPQPRRRTQEEIEGEIQERLKELQFKSKPVDTKVLYGEPKFRSSSSSRHIKPTGDENEIQPYHFRTIDRANSRLRSRGSQNQAMAVNTRETGTSCTIDQSNQSNPHKAVKSSITLSANSDHQSTLPLPAKLTVPMSPKLHGTARASSAPARRQLPHHSILEKQRNDAKLSIPLSTKLQLTDPQPFQLRSDTRGSVYQQSLSEEIKRREDEEKKLREYHAPPVPPSICSKRYNPILPKPEDKKLTEPIEFHLESAFRHERAEALFQQSLRENENEVTQMAIFHALPIPVTTYKPEVIPSTSLDHHGQTNTVPVSITFATEKRACERRKFQHQIEEHAKEVEHRRMLEKKFAEDVEKEELLKLRNLSVAEGGMMFRAQPILTEDLFPSHHVTPKPLTEPVTPILLTEMRAERYCKNTVNES